MLSQEQQQQLKRQKQFYLLVGFAGLALMSVVWLMQPGPPSALEQIAYTAGSVILGIWTASGVSGAMQREAELQKAAVARAQEERLHAEAQEAAQRTAEQVNAQRTVSHGGMTIDLHKAHASEQEGD